LPNLKRVDIVNRLRMEETRAKEAVYFAFPFRVSPPELAYQVQNAWARPNVDQLPGAAAGGSPHRTSFPCAMRESSSRLPRRARR